MAGQDSSKTLTIRELPRSERPRERLIDLGAKPVSDLRRPDGTGWVTLADPEGNEFCILRGDARSTRGRKRRS